MKKVYNIIFKGKEGNIFIFSLFLTTLLIISILITYIFDAKSANKITALVVSNLFVGRVPSLSLGYASQLSHLTVIGVNIVTELILVTSLYPLFIFSFKGILKIKPLEDFFTQVQEKKKQHQEKFEKYGKVGLFIFVFIPFWMTGPIVGAIIGYLIGLKHYTIMLIVFIATTIAITLWGLFLNEIIEFLLAFDTRYVWIILLFIVVTALVLKIKKKLYKKEK
ncbi:hypothetical protein CP960_04185 [Malaciobacter halophilus]|uniref:Small multi-drug export protein n=1 Tax=Malaciobacter halophilus TaxID=197482 RepID=A0A2N1J4K3_9BACT|nr:small multi-drug export protein [Malaciobacter halophilus]AXH09430.1 putative small multi-drug export protein [Malaciobacter halophilus]PKI81480.1 hypothetical protein CP960_04185 [Malaciobacter halophilus]